MGLPRQVCPLFQSFCNRLLTPTVLVPLFAVSIDNHKFWVYAADGQFHDVQQVDVINIPPGERFTAMIKLDQEGDFAIRASASITPQFISGYGVLSYNPTATTSQSIPEPQNQALGYGGDTKQGFTELDPMTLKAYPSTLTPPQTADTTIFLELFRLNSLEWSMNTNPFARESLVLLVFVSSCMGRALRIAILSKPSWNLLNL